MLTQLSACLHFYLYSLGQGTVGFVSVGSAAPIRRACGHICLSFNFNPLQLANLAYHLHSTPYSLHSNNNRYAHAWTIKSVEILPEVCGQSTTSSASRL